MPYRFVYFLCLLHTHAWFLTSALAQADNDLELLNPSANELYLSGLHLARERGDYNAAFEKLSLAIELDPLNPAYRNTMGIIYLKKGESKLAILELQKSISLKPSFAKSHRNLALIYARQKKYKEALDVTDRACECSDDLLHRLTRSLVYLDLRRFKDAVVEATHVINAQPMNHEAYSLRSLARLELNDFENACEDAKSALQYGNQFYFQAHYVIGRFHDSQGNYVEAIESYDKAILDAHLIQSKGFLSRVYSYRAIASMSSGIFKSAEKDLRKAIKLDGSNGSAYISLSMLRLLNHDSPKAVIVDIDMLIKKGVSLPYLFYIRGTAHLMLRDFDRAILDAEQAVSLLDGQLGSTTAKVLLAKLLTTCPHSSKRDGQRALLLMQQTCDDTKWKDCEAIQAFAAACAEVGDFDSAVTWQERAIDMIGNKPAHQIQVQFIQGGNNCVDSIRMTRSDRKNAEFRLRHYKNRKPYRILDDNPIAARTLYLR